MKLALLQPVFRIRIPIQGFFWIRIEFFLAGSGSGFDEYGSDNTDFNISRNSIMVPIVELFKILIKMASCYTCSRPFKKSDLDPGAHKQKQKT